MLINGLYRSENFAVLRSIRGKVKDGSEIFLLCRRSCPDDGPLEWRRKVLDKFNSRAVANYYAAYCDSFCGGSYDEKSRKAARESWRVDNRWRIDNA